MSAAAGVAVRDPHHGAAAGEVGRCRDHHASRPAPPPPFGVQVGGLGGCSVRPRAFSLGLREAACSSRRSDHGPAAVRRDPRQVQGHARRGLRGGRLRGCRDAQTTLGDDARGPRAAHQRPDPGAASARQGRLRRQPLHDAAASHGAHRAELGPRPAQQHAHGRSRRRSLRARRNLADVRQVAAGGAARHAGAGRLARGDLGQGQAVRPLPLPARADGAEPGRRADGRRASLAEAGGGRAQAMAARRSGHVQAGRGPRQPRRGVLRGRDGGRGGAAAGPDRARREVAQRHVAVLRALAGGHAVQAHRGRGDLRGRQLAFQDEDVGP
mmetsp:Transcript_11312/g.32162  ORF Transcript_11312/g.32162 Transcript_11312/m.32162 type:complete len:326 (+) Transcript_11312:223-1200(+)